MEALDKAVDLLGTTYALASGLGVGQSVVSMWKSRGRVPAEYCPGIERLTNRQVRCEELRPDVDWAYIRAAAIPDVETA